jgi:hypothetical protein
MLSSPPSFYFVVVQQRRQHCFFFFFGCNAEGDGNVVAVAFYFGDATTKKVMTALLLSPFFCCSAKGDGSVAFSFRFAGCWYRCNEEEEEDDDNFRHLLRWLCSKKKWRPMSFLVVLL